MTVAELIRFLLGAVLVFTAGAKLAAGQAGREALRTYGLAASSSRTAFWAFLIAVESGLGGAVAAGVPGTAEAAAGMLAVFTAALLFGIGRGRAGQPCGCLGGRSRIGWAAVARSAVLAVACAAVPVLPDTRPSTQTWLVIGLGASLTGVAALAIALLALARELGELKLTVLPQRALSLEHEGPELGSRVSLRERFRGDAALSLAVFVSPNCPLCEALRPSLQLVATDPQVELQLFDENDDAGAWESLAVPGSPYAVVLGREGEVLAKGSFNTLLQLESLLASAGTRTEVHA
jgi:hypothetical protein